MLVTLASKIKRHSFKQYLLDHAEIQSGYRLIRNPIIFTNIRIIFTDKQGATGRKMSVKSIFLMNIVNVEMKTAGADIKGKSSWDKKILTLGILYYQLLKSIN